MDTNQEELLVTKEAFTPALTIQETEEGSNGGEWNVLKGEALKRLNRIILYLNQEQISLAAKIVGLLIALAVFLHIYKGLLHTINGLPLAPELLELSGLIWFVSFSQRNLLRTSDRNQTISRLHSKWCNFVGR